MHDCPECGYACDCDMEDHYNETPDDCSCDCWLDDVERADDDEDDGTRS